MYTEPDPAWILTERIRVTKRDDGTMFVESMTTPERPGMTLSIGKGRKGGRKGSGLLFNGVFIYVEEFMVYVGLMDEVSESGDNPVILDPEF